MELASPTQVGDRYVPQIIPNITFDELYLSPTKRVNVSLIQRGSWSKNSFMEYIPPKLEVYTFFYSKGIFLHILVHIDSTKFDYYHGKTFYQSSIQKFEMA